VSEVETGKYEYMVMCWGGFYNTWHVEVHGFRPGWYWFDTAEARAAYVDELRVTELMLDATTLMLSFSEGTETRMKTVADMVIEVNGTRIEYEYFWGYDRDLGNCNDPESVHMPLIVNEIEKKHSDLLRFDAANTIAVCEYLVKQIPGTTENFEALHD
jgi:hypothetical protein